MALKTIVERLDDVPAALHAEYKEQDGKFILDIDGIDNHPSVVNLKTAHERTKADRTKFSADLAAARARLEGLPEDFTAEEYERLKSLAEGKEPPKTDEQVARVREQLERKHTGELGKKDERIALLEAQIRRTTIDDGLMRALVEANVSKEYLAAAKALLKDKGVVKLVEDEGQFQAVVETDMGPMALSKFVNDWTGSDEGKVFVAKPTGGDAKGGNGRSGEANPWAKDTRNMTEQGRILKTDKVKAERMMRAAGLSDLDIERALGRRAA